MTKSVAGDELTRIPGLFRGWELAQIFKPDRSYRIEDAGRHADGTPLLAIYTDPAETVPLAVGPIRDHPHRGG